MDIFLFIVAVLCISWFIARFFRSRDEKENYNRGTKDHYNRNPHTYNGEQNSWKKRSVLSRFFVLSSGER